MEKFCTPSTGTPRLWLLASMPDGPKASPKAGAVRNAAARSLRILIVEDEILVALDTRALLESSGHVVVGIADSADHALATALRERPDLALMDIALVGPRDGVDTALELRERLEIPSLFITAHADPHMRQRAVPAKPLGFLTKPVDEEMLRRALARL